MEKETWKPVVGYEGLYEVSSLGNIRSLDRPAGPGRGQQLRRGRVLKPYPVKGRYHQVSLSAHGGRKKTCYHIIVAEAFLGPRPEGYHVCHNDGDPTNNRLDNLRYDTVANNARDRIVHGTVPRGENHHNHKLTDYDVAAIRVLTDYGFEGGYVSRLFGVAETTVSKIKLRKQRT